MPQVELLEALDFGSGQGGKLLARDLAQPGQRTSDVRTRLGTTVGKVMAAVEAATLEDLPYPRASCGRSWRMPGWQ